MSKESIEAVVAAYFANMATLNPERWVELFAEDGISYDPVGHPPMKVHEGYLAFFQQMKATFEQLETMIEHTFVAGNEAAVKWTIQGVSNGGKSVRFEGITVFEMNEAGKIQTTRAYWSPEVLMAQIRE
ncbi:MAG TPA: ketosteroid isomerase [Cyanobacteria bacterium UBA8553]|nr:ketosteroid isomerase [Cyanobacteria bacterium UBA8553]HAJ61764.1 ketosteroid isomerase [Cyanobacteria bacterium UBA8543]